MSTTTSTEHLINPLKAPLNGGEVNFDGLVGLTHHYAGLAFGNKASMNNQFQQSNPKLAAKQGLLKMKALMERGFKQAVLPPHQRPYIPGLRNLGFTGTEAQVLQKASKEAPELLSMLSSASNMWVANAATISPSADTMDGRVHITPANLQNKFHRSIEHEMTGTILQAIFNNPKRFAHHHTLPHNLLFGDEGAANHCRLGGEYGQKALEVFVYGVDSCHPHKGPKLYPARQTKQASQTIARLHQLDPDNVLFVQQNPDAIDAGVFHNDVISVSNQNVLFYHESAFVDSSKTIEQIRQKLDNLEIQFEPIMVPKQEVSLDDCVQSYLFNSQILTKPDGKMLLVLPKEAQTTPAVWQYLQNLVAAGTSINELAVFDLKESMQNGGGPACLRLRIAMTQAELTSINQGVLLDTELFEKLDKWIDTHYRDQLIVTDLADPQLLHENYRALDELTTILNLGSIYDFQRV